MPLSIHHFIAAAVLAATQWSAHAAPSFTCRPLADQSPSAETQNIVATALNVHRQVVGVGFGSWRGSLSRGPMLWGRNRTGHRKLHDAYWPTGLNDHGVIVGNRTDDGGRLRPTMWKDGQEIDLGALPAADGSGRVAAVNNKGHAVGSSHVWRDDLGQAVNKGTLWRDGQVIRLPGLTERDTTSASDINDEGVVVGTNGIIQPVVWKAEVPTPLPSPPGAYYSAVDAINNLGLSVGLSGYATGGRGTAWQDLVPVDLGALPDFDDTRATGLNDGGAIVGVATNGTGPSTAVYWARIDEAPQDLNQLVKGACIDAFGIQRHLSGASRINGQGVILAYAVDYSSPYLRSTAFILTPR